MKKNNQRQPNEKKTSNIDLSAHNTLRSSASHEMQRENESSPPPNSNNTLDIRSTLPGKKRVKIDETQSGVGQKHMKPATGHLTVAKPEDGLSDKKRKTDLSESYTPGASSLLLLRKPIVEKNETRGQVDDAALSEMLNLPEYDELKDQLVNLAAAKLSGNFTYQVAASVESLMKCANKSKEDAMKQFEQARANLTDRVS